MSDETTRARLLTIGSLEWALNLPKCADDDVSRVIAYRKEIEAQCTQAAAHAETVARLKQRLDEEVAAHFRCADSLMRAEADVQRLEQALAHWQTCSNCGERMDAPGHCGRAIHEEVKGLHQMHDETLTRAEKAEAEVQRLTEALEREREQNNHRRGRRISIMELISGGPLDPLPYLADSIHDLNGLIENSPQADNNPQSPASQRRFWLEHSVHICEQVERHVARLNIEAEEMRAQLLRLAAPVPERKE